MRWLKIIALGLLIWGLGLVWPELNQALSPQLMLGAVFGLGAALVVYLMLNPRKVVPDEPSPKSNQRPRSTSDSRPIKPLGLV
jgi:hypothetical protein